MQAKVHLLQEHGFHVVESSKELSRDHRIPLITDELVIVDLGCHDNSNDRYQVEIVLRQTGAIRFFCL